MTTIYVFTVSDDKEDISYSPVKYLLEFSNWQGYAITFPNHAFIIRRVVCIVQYSLLLILGCTKEWIMNASEVQKIPISALVISVINLIFSIEWWLLAFLLSKGSFSFTIVLMSSWLDFNCQDMISLGYLAWNYLKTSLLEYAIVLIHFRQEKLKMLLLGK